MGLGGMSAKLVFPTTLGMDSPMMDRSFCLWMVVLFSSMACCG